MKKMGGQIKPFTKQQETKIREEYLITPVKTLAAELGVHPGRVQRFLKREGLEIPLEIRKKRRSLTQFPKGNVPFNKGLKQTDWMSPEDLEKVKKHWYKKGNIPHNVHPDGDGALSMRRDPSGRYYQYIRTSLSVWELHHRVIWEKAHGPIPEGHVVAFKDDDTSNVTLENLELISMVENMYRNSYKNYPEEIIPSMVLVNKLETKIKNLQNG